MDPQNETSASQDLLEPRNDQEQNNALHTCLFRNELIEEFHLLDNLTDRVSVQAPKVSTHDIKEEKTLLKALREDPSQLVKFMIFKRKQKEVQVDKRYTRTKNLSKFPIGVYAGRIVNNDYFRNFLSLLIILNGIMSGVEAEYYTVKSEYAPLFDAIWIIDEFTMIFFAFEILLKWLDDFKGFWFDGWNVFDFFVTLGSALPEFLGNSMGSSSVLKTLRTFRILRTLKIVVKYGNLKVIVLTIIEVLKNLAFIMLLLLIVAFIFAVVSVSIFDDYSKSDMEGLLFQQSFDTIGNAFMSLFILLTIDQWEAYTNDLIRVSDPTLTIIFIISWVWLGAFMFRNIFIGVMVENFDKIHKELHQKEKEYNKLKKFERMRKKLNKELQVQGNLKESLQNLVAPKADPLKPTSNEIGSRIKDIMSSAENAAKGWDATVQNALRALQADQKETMWPRDRLFEYYQTMESLMENMKEYDELMTMASKCLIDLHDT